jgi:apolipoprotein N-acyltransferase
MNREALARLRNYGPTLLRLLLWSGLAAVAFHVAYGCKGASYLVVVYLFALLQLAQTERWREAAYSGLAVGLLLAAGRLAFFWRIFSGGAIGLWYVYAFWIALFVALARLCLRGFKPSLGWALLPFVWTGLEYFRSELYYLRFSWLSPGYAFAEAPWVAPVGHMGMYGTGFLLMSVACVAAFLWQRSRWQAAVAVAAGVGLLAVWGATSGARQAPSAAGVVHIAGIQMEVPSDDDVLRRLNEVVQKHPETELVVLSEYTFDDVVPTAIKAWCKDHHRYLVVGGKDPAPNAKFYNTAFVVGPSGEVVFQQVKAVPIQFFKDGLPAPEQKLWASPWGKLGLCICYDLSYTRVTDQLVRLGAQGLIVPTMDALDWGQNQHELHARVAPTRAAEYGLPIFRLASSGISQWVDHRGQVRATAPFPGDGAVLVGTLELQPAGRLPLDRWLAPFSTGLTLLLLLFFLIRKTKAKFARSRSAEALAPLAPALSEGESAKPLGSVSA